MKNIYGILSGEPQPMELDNRSLALEAAKEGIVLLKNEGVLPLKNHRIALYGMGARKTVKGGLGSGSVNERYSVNIEDGLKNAGCEITTQAWLDDYDREFTATYQEYHDMVEEKVAGLTNPVQIIPLAHSFVYRYPSGRAITEEDVKASSTDTAVYVLMRQAGECNDRRLEAGDWYLTDREKQNIKTLAQNYANTVLVINVGGLVDLSILDEVPGIGAVVLFGQGGEEGGNALASLLVGTSNFSGKLADTWPLRYEDIPNGENFSYLNGDTRQEYYREDLYVGYRYFDSFHKPVRYPFGYGLSYTTFAIKMQSAQVDGTKVTLQVQVTNTGDRAGRQVVQVYVSAPKGKIKKAFQSLVAFEKTAELAPGAEETLKLTFDMRDCASYDMDRSAWVLEAGNYMIRLGDHSRNTKIAAVVSLDGEALVRQCRTCCPCTDDLDLLTAEESEEAEETAPSDALNFGLHAKEIPVEVVDYSEPELVESDREKAILDQLSDDELAELLRGGDLQNAPKEAKEIHGAAGKTATALLEKGIENVCFSDGPAGINIAEEVKQLADGSFSPAKVPERYQWGILGKMMVQRLAMVQGTPVYRYCTAWPVELVLAQSWNKSLLYEVGKAAGQEAAAYGISVWLAPAMNIHRNPLGGRTFEYYSEDPVLTGELAAAQINGVQENPGVGVSAKHFCCNNQEDNRNGSSSNVSEQALREIYLKGFEIAVKKAQPMTVMSSYNLLNHVYTANNHDLLTDILRCEFGFKGLVMTDWGSCKDGVSGDAAACAPAGNDLVMPGESRDTELIRAAIEDGRITKEMLRKSACRVLRLIPEDAIHLYKN